MEQTKQVISLPLHFQFGGTEDTIYPTVLADEHDVILVDCGFLGFLPRIEDALRQEGLSCKDLTGVVITHHDHDHMGSLHELKRQYPHIRVIASAAEAPYIAGEIKALRLEQAEQRQASLPEEQKAFGQAFMDMLRRVPPCPVDSLVRHGDRFPWCGGCTILETPGHTSGHISLLLDTHRTVIAGDAAVCENGRLIVANPEFAYDLPAAEQSLAALLACDADTCLCYHGGSLPLHP